MYFSCNSHSPPTVSYAFENEIYWAGKWAPFLDCFTYCTCGPHTYYYYRTITQYLPIPHCGRLLRCFESFSSFFIVIYWKRECYPYSYCTVRKKVCFVPKADRINLFVWITRPPKYCSHRTWGTYAPRPSTRNCFCVRIAASSKDYLLLYDVQYISYFLLCTRTATDHVILQYIIEWKGKHSPRSIESSKSLILLMPFVLKKSQQI